MATPTAEKLELYYGAKYLTADNDALTGFTVDSGSTKRLIVNAEHNEADDFWNGAIIKFVDGPNAGEFSRVKDFDAASDTLTLSRELPSVPGIGNTYNLVVGGNWRSSELVPGLNQTGLAMGGVTIDLIEHLNNPGSALLDFTLSGTLMKWRAPGSSTLGIGINVGSNGTFTMFDGEDTSKYITITVVAASLPGGNTADTLTLTRPSEILVPDAVGFETSSGVVRYFFLPFKNADGTFALVDLRVFLTIDPDSDVEIGLDAPSTLQFENPVDTNTAPAGVSFSAPLDYNAGVQVGDLASGDIYAVWIKETIAASTPAKTGVLDIVHFAWE